MGDEKVTLGERLKKQRLRLGLRQYQVAREIGMSAPALVGYENDYRRPSADTIVKLSKLYGVSVNELMAGDGDHSHRGDSRTLRIEDSEYTLIPLVREMTVNTVTGAFEFEVVGQTASTLATIVPGPLNDTSHYVWLRVSDDGLIGMHIMGDGYVLLRIQPMVENGALAAVCVDNQPAICRKVFYANEQVILSTANQDIPDRSVPSSASKIIGKIIATMGFISS